MTEPVIADDVLDEMKAYYEARAAEYDEWFYRRGRYDYGEELNERWHGDSAKALAVLDNFKMTGDVLELAPGTGIWTQRLVKTAQTVTAVDASPQMIEINRAKVGDGKVNYMLSDLFKWSPLTQYDGILFAFWISHIPSERLPDFLKKVATALRPGGKVFFVDSRRDQTMSARNHVLPENGSQIMKRILNDGRSYQIVKNFFDPAQLEQLCAEAGLDVQVCETDHYFFYGTGVRM